MATALSASLPCVARAVRQFPACRGAAQRGGCRSAASVPVSGAGSGGGFMQAPRSAAARRARLARAQAKAGAAPGAAVDDDFAPELDWPEPPDTRIPVTVITGFLGSGKTTLLNHILTQPHGQRLAVIENEVGQIDIDSELVASRQQLEGTDATTIMMLNNGCLCCTVRDDLVDALGALARRKDEFDRIVIETTGLASPAPIIQTFFMEPSMQENVRLDGVLTLVDAKHVGVHLDEVKTDDSVNEALQQIAYADRLVLNKTDLVTEGEADALERRLRDINGLATIARATRAAVTTDYVLGVGGYDLDRVETEVNPDILREQDIAAHSHDHDHGHDHDHSHSHGESPGTHGSASGGAAEHSHGGGHGHDHGHSHAHDHGGHDHHHDDSVTSVSVQIDGDMDLEMVNQWLGSLINIRGNDLYRMKGILAISGFEDTFVFQGVHSLFEGSPARPWREGEPRTSRMVFIGRDLDEELLRGGFEDCRAEVVQQQLQELRNA